ncbi:protein of unknown function [Xylanibacter ruminicola]|uniref:DUF349 domain-containing protein n=3 Tax=Xylanibacter ruminicola TaxID=839 RepID=A0A1M7GFF1_XYLRU|nr:DUF349 domain-containing protein [Xylanibacter ruminicola]SFC09558.1 protein of unknown function [Xylanibacter ruminicola]SHM15000.1 protein of unknown function [Xylanibacter ruminicola]
MMDSQENTLELGKNEEVVNEEVTSQVETTENSEPAAEQAEEQTRVVYETKADVLHRLQDIAHGEEVPQKDEVEYLKSSFYKLHVAEREAKLKAYLNAGGDPEQYQYTPDEQEEAFKAEMGIIKEKRAKVFKEQEAEKQENLTKKLAIIDRIKAMVTTPDEANKNYKEFKALQEQWREIKNVPADKANELWRNYQLYVEQFYDMLRLNSEAREYDFKKNLELKTALCEAAEKLADEEDVISAFHQLQKLHQEYREIGPVAKEQREEIWNRFKAASSVINKRHQQHFEGVRAKEEDNLARKTVLCEKVEAIAAEENKGSGDWEKHTKQIIDIQTEWKTIGFAPQKMNVKIFERFRAACDDFFGRKAAYFKGLKETFKENAEKKRALIEKAKELQSSTEWKSTSDKFIALQKEWKTIGMVPKKLGDQLWEEFLAACNTFFEARNAAGAGARGEERENLEKKLGIIEQLKALATETGEEVAEKVQKLVDEYNAVGHVPYKEKDKLYKEYHAVLDKLYKDLNISVAKRKLNNFKQNLKNVAERGENALDNERTRLFRQYENLKSEIQTYENNLGFLNASSKKGNSLIDEMNRKVQKLKDDMNLIREKIKAIDAENKQ